MDFQNSSLLGDHPFSTYARRGRGFKQKHMFAYEGEGRGSNKSIRTQNKKNTNQF